MHRAQLFEPNPGEFRANFDEALDRFRRNLLKHGHSGNHLSDEELTQTILNLAEVSYFFADGNGVRWWRQIGGPLKTSAEPHPWPLYLRGSRADR